MYRSDCRNTAAAACSAALAAACHGPEASKAAAAACAASSKEEGEKSSAPRLAEEDLVFFRVRKSIEGYPQAVCVQRLHKLTGSVLHPPEEGGRPGTIKSEEAVVASERRVDSPNKNDVAMASKLIAMASNLRQALLSCFYVYFDSPFFLCFFFL